MKLILTGILLFCFSQLIGQELVRIDDLGGGYAGIESIDISVDGKRVYLFDRAKDSILINNFELKIEPADAEITSPYYFGRTYLTAVENSGEPTFIKKPGGTTVTLRDEQIYLFTSFAVDTLLTTDTSFLNIAEGSGTNLLLQIFDFNGNLQDFKHWESPYDCTYSVNDAEIIEDQIFVSGSFGGNQNGLLLDGNFLDLGTGNGNGFFGVLNSNLEFQWLKDIRGLGTERYHRFAANDQAHFLLSGFSDSDEVEVCEKIIENTAQVTLGSEFLYLVEIDDSGNCINTFAPNYDFGNMYPTGELALTNNVFVISGVYSSAFIEFDELRLENPLKETRGFVVKFKNDLLPQSALQLSGSQGLKLITTIDRSTEDFIWIGGYFESDTLQIVSAQVLNETGGAMGFIAKMDQALHPVYIQTFSDGLTEKIMRGQDEEIYLLLRQAVNQHTLYRIDDPVLTQEININESQITLFPNPVKSSELLKIEFINVDSAELLQAVAIYSASGQSVDATFESNENVITFEADFPPGIYFAVLNFESGIHYKRFFVN